MNLRDQLQKVYDDNGRLDPDLLVKTATPPTHPLHDRFEWDDKVAGPAWRRQQAHDLITRVKIVTREATDTEEARFVRGFHAVRTDSGFTYEPADVVAADPVLTEILLRDMEREWQAMFRRYSGFEEFIAMVRKDLDDEDGVVAA